MLAKVAALNEGRALVYESGLHDLIPATHADGRVKAVTKLTDELDDCAIACFGTQSEVDGVHNISQIAQVTRAVARGPQAGQPNTADSRLPLHHAA